MNFSWAFIFDTTGYVVKAAADPFPDDLSGDGRPGAGLSPGAAENVSGSGGESSGIHLRFLFPEHSASGAAFPGFLRDSETDQFYLLRWGTCLGFH